MKKNKEESEYIEKDKIYRSPNRVVRTEPKPKKNEKNRKRNTFYNFRVSPTEKQIIDARIAMTGLPKAEFFIQSCMYQAVLAKGSIRTFEAIRRAVEDIAKQLEINPKLENLDIVQLGELRIILEILQKLFGKK